MPIKKSQAILKHFISSLVFDGRYAVLRKRNHILWHLGPVQTSFFCRAELNSGIKFDKSTAEARRLNQIFELSSN